MRGQRYHNIDSRFPILLALLQDDIVAFLFVPFFVEMEAPSQQYLDETTFRSLGSLGMI